MHVSTVSSVIHQYVTVNIWSEGGFRQRRALPLPFFASSWIYPLEYLAVIATRMAAFQVKPFVFEALFDSFLPCLGSTQGGSDKKLNTCAGNENFMPTKFHKHPSSSSVVKAKVVHSPFLHLNKYITNSIKFLKHLNLWYQHSPDYKHRNYISLMQIKHFTA